MNERLRMPSNSRDVGMELTGTRVLLVSDDLDMGRIWAYALLQTGLEVTLARLVDDPLSLWGEGAYDLAIVDIYDLHREAISLCRQLRAQAVNPIVLLTPTGDEDRVMEAYQAGVDECVVKPTSPCLLLAKVRVWLRRSWTVPARALDRFQVDGLCLDSVRREVVLNGAVAAKLTNLEFRLLHLLMSHRGQVLQSDLILDRVWGYFGGGDCAMLKNVVYRLRRKIEPDPSRPTYIQTVTGEGYAFLPN